MKTGAIISILCFLCFSSIGFAQVAVLSTDPNEAILIKPKNTTVFQEFSLNPQENIELVQPVGMRDYYNQNYYFRFFMPELDDVSAFIQFSQDVFVGMAAYVKDEGEFFPVDMTYINSSPGMFTINQLEAYSGAEIIVRLWFDQDMSGNNVSLALRRKDPLSVPKAIDVSSDVYSPSQLVQDILVTGCLEAMNVTFNGNEISAGYFSGNIGNSGFDEGILITSGEAVTAEGPDVGTSSGGAGTGLSDPDLDALNPGFDIHDAAVLEFDFIPASDSIEFQYIFGSEEFHEFANSSFNDVFGFFLSGPGINGPYTNNAINIALLPDGTPVTIDNVYNNSAYYVGSTDSNPGSGMAYNNTIEYDGASIPLTAVAEVQACEVYHIKLAVGDAGDSSYDSGVFFKAGSFTSGASFTAASFNPWYSTDVVYEGCDTYVIFTRVDENTINDSIPVPLDIGGTATMGDDFNQIEDTFYIQAGQMADTLVITAFEDGVVEGVEVLTFTFSDGCPCDQTTMTVNIEINDELSWEPSLSNTGPICLGDTATVTLSLPAGVDLALADWLWGYNGSQGYSIEVNPDTTTTYTLEWTHPCETFEVTSTVEVVNPPEIDLGDDFTVPGYTTPVDADMDAGNTGYWELISGPGNADYDDINSGATNITVDSLGVYQFVWHEFSLPPDCGESDTVEIEFYHVPDAHFIISESNCYGDILTVTYVGNAYDWAIFTWDFDGATIISGDGHGPFQIVYSEPGNHDISLEVNELGYIVDETNSVLVPVDLTHVLSTNDDPCFNSCNGSAEVQVNGGTLPYNYSWAGGLSTIDDLCAGDYGLTVTDGNGCVVSEQFVIDQPAEMVFDTSFVNVDCNGNSTGSATIMVTGGTGLYDYNWSNGGNSSSLMNIPAGTYTVNVFDVNGCMVTETFIITEPDPLFVNFSEDMAICEGQVVNLNATPVGGVSPYTVFWSDGGAYSPAPGTQSVSPSESTNYSVYVVDAHNCSSPVVDMDLTVSPFMWLELSTVDNSCHESCDGSAELLIHGGLPPFDFSWASDNRILENICSGLYDVSVVDQIGCGADTVFFIDQPTEIFYETFSEAASCPGLNDGRAWVEVVGGEPPYNYIWENGETTSSIDVAGGTYTLTISDANNCRKETEVFVDAPQAITIIPGPNPTICIGGTARLTAEAMGGTDPYSFAWQSEDSIVGFDHVFDVTPVVDTRYYLTVTDDHGCQAYHDFVVNVNPPLEIHSITVNQDTVCANAPIRLFVDAEGGSSAPYTLTLQDGQVIPSPFTLYPQESQMWYITLSDDCETPAVTDSIYIPVWPVPENMFISDVVSGCPPLDVQFSEIHQDNGYTYNWSYGDEGFGFNQNPSHVYEESGLFTVSLLIRTKDGCETVKTIPNMIEVFPQPFVDFYTTPNEANVLDPQIQFTSISEFADSLFWYFGDGDSAIWQMTDPVHFYHATGEYEVTLVGENSFGCTNQEVKTVQIIDQPTFYAPTLFTPNGDGENDCFRICGNGIDPNEFYIGIYDRWGELVFETEFYDSNVSCDQCGEGAWDGTFLGNRLEGDDYIAPGVYSWFTKFKDSFGNWHEYQGIIRLAR